MSALLVGYARCSTDQQDLTAQRDALLGLGVEPERIYVDHGLTGTNRDGPGDWGSMSGSVAALLVLGAWIAAGVLTRRLMRWEPRK